VRQSLRTSREAAFINNEGEETDLQRVCNFLQTSLEALTAPHDVLDVVHVWEPEFEQLEEGLFGRRQRLRRKELDEVTKVVAAEEEKKKKKKK
jgi:hypothetical protein